MSTDLEHVTYFEWTELLAIALGRRHLNNGKAAVAMFIARTCKGTTGEGAYVDADRIGAELDMSERQVWRHVADLVDGGWIERTQAPTRGTKGRAGRRARYRLTRAHVFTSHESPMFRLTELPARTSHENPNGTNPNRQTINESNPESSDTSVPNRLTLSPESSDTPTPTNGTVTPSCGTPSVGTPQLQDQMPNHRTRARLG